MNNFQNPGDFRCPFCGGTYTASMNPPSAMHSVPPCQQFIVLDPDKFLEQARINSPIGKPVQVTNN